VEQIKLTACKFQFLIVCIYVHCLYIIFHAHSSKDFIKQRYNANASWPASCSMSNMCVSSCHCSTFSIAFTWLTLTSICQLQIRCQTKSKLCYWSKWLNLLKFRMQICLITLIIKNLSNFLSTLFKQWKSTKRITFLTILTYWLVTLLAILVFFPDY